MNQIKDLAGNKNTNHIPFWKNENKFHSSPNVTIRGEIRIRTKLTS
jgi:hypothetical protein